MDKIVIEYVHISFEDKYDGNLFFKPIYGSQPGKLLSDSVSRIFKVIKKPWKVSEIRALPSWKRMQKASDDEALSAFINFCQENDIFSFIIEYDRRIRIVPDFTSPTLYLPFSDSVRSKVKPREIDLPEDLGGDKIFVISNVDLREISENVLKEMLRITHSSYTILDVTQDRIDQMLSIMRIKKEESGYVNAEADILFKEEREKEAVAIKAKVKAANIQEGAVIIGVIGFILLIVVSFFQFLASAPRSSSGSYESSGGSMTINGESYTQQQFEDKLRGEAERLYDNCQAFGSGFSDKCP